MELGGAAQRLPGPNISGSLSGMVHDDDGDAMSALQLAEESEQRRHLAADILVDAVETDEGIEDKQARPELGDGFLEIRPIGVEIEAQAWRGDDLDVQVD